MSDSNPTQTEKKPRTHRTKKEVQDAAKDVKMPSKGSEPHEVSEPVFNYFLITGQIEFCESRHNKAPRTMLVNTVFRGSNMGMTAKDLAAIQTNLQMRFHHKYSKMHKQPPHEITDVVMFPPAYIGTFTETDFQANAPVEAVQASEETAQAEPTKT